MLLAFMVLVFTSVIMKDFIFGLIIPESIEITESQKSSQAIAKSILDLEKVTFDVSVLQSDYFLSISQLPSFPTDAKTLSNFGKLNPFLGGFSVTSALAPTNATGTTVGGLIVDGQRAANGGNALAPVGTNPTSQQRGSTTPVTTRRR